MVTNLDVTQVGVCYTLCTYDSGVEIFTYIPPRKPVYKFRKDNVNRSLLNTIAKHNPSKKSYILPKVIKS